MYTCTHTHTHMTHTHTHSHTHTFTYTHSLSFSLSLFLAYTHTHTHTYTHTHTPRSPILSSQCQILPLPDWLGVWESVGFDVPSGDQKVFLLVRGAVHLDSGGAHKKSDSRENSQ